MARSERIWTRCPKCEERWLRVKAGGPCGGRVYSGTGVSGIDRLCDGVVVAASKNAPRSATGEARVRRSVNLLPETAKVLTATQVAALADAAVKDGGQ